MKIKLITAAALTLALAGQALAQDTKATTGGATPAPAVKVEAPKTTAIPAAIPVAPSTPTATVKPTDAPKAATAPAVTPAAPTAAPVTAPKAATAPVAAPVTTPTQAVAPKIETKPSGVGGPKVEEKKVEPAKTETKPADVKK